MDFERRIEDVVIGAYEKIQKSKVLNYHCFIYRSFTCYIFQCLSAGRWVGCIETYTDMVWPERTTQRPFRVKIDFKIPLDNGATLIGFHTRHVVYDAYIAGHRNRQIGADFMAIELRKFIDTIINEQNTLETIHMSKKRK